MHAVQSTGELILERGEGCHLWDDKGNRYIDSTGGLWYANVGYGRAEIAAAAAAQMRKLHAYSHYGDVSSRPTTDLAERISAIAPMEDAAVFFTSGGGESIETVVKLVRRYWSLLEQPDRTVIISRERAYHGLAGYGTSIVGIDAFKVGVGPLAGDTARVAWDSADALESTIREIGPDRVAAFFCEPIIGAGGVLLPPDGYLHATREICRAHGVLVLADGAHAPGSIPLDIPSLGVDYYTANLHKWAWAPRSSGLLWAPPEHQQRLHPPVISRARHRVHF